eukprot:gene5480-5566_t
MKIDVSIMDMSLMSSDGRKKRHKSSSSRVFIPSYVFKLKSTAPSVFHLSNADDETLVVPEEGLVVPDVFEFAVVPDVFEFAVVPDVFEFAVVPDVFEFAVVPDVFEFAVVEVRGRVVDFFIVLVEVFLSIGK